MATQGETPKSKKFTVHSKQVDAPSLINGSLREFIGSCIITVIVLYGYEVYYKRESAHLTYTGACGLVTAMVAFFLTGRNSGFFNPLVNFHTMILWVAHNYISVYDAFKIFCLYSIANLLGTFTGAGVVLALIPTGERYGTPSTQPGVTDWSAWFMQLLVYTLYGCSTSIIYKYKKQRQTTAYEASVMRGVSDFSLRALSLILSGGVLDVLHWFVAATLSGDWTNAFVWSSTFFISIVLTVIILLVLKITDTRRYGVWSKLKLMPKNTKSRE